MKKNYISPEIQEIEMLSSDILLASGETEEEKDTLIDVTGLFV